MMDALKDFNIPIMPLEALTINEDSSPLSTIWSYLDDDDIVRNSAGLFQKTVLQFPVRYQLEVCISHGYLNEYNITPVFIDKLASISARDARCLLERVAEKKTRYFNPMDIFSIPRDKKVDSSRAIPETCVLMRRATVTPTGILFQTPSVEISNRVIRHYGRYSDRFMRISFTDEKSSGRIRFNDGVSSNELFTRVYRALERGVVMGDRKYEFLAFGNSQLREHGAYFFAKTDDTSSEDIRMWMGVFTQIKVVAKYASRLGQCFSTTRAFRSSKVECIKIPDIERNGYMFSDGVGKISSMLAFLITDEMVKSNTTDKKYRSCCFQFRLGGCKGVLVLDPNVSGLEAHIRESQVKFWSSHAALEIIRCSQFASASLNRQLIQVMSSLGVPNEYFEDRLAKVLYDYTLAVTDPHKALELLTKHVDPNHMTLQIASLVRAGFMDSREPFVVSPLTQLIWRNISDKSSSVSSLKYPLRAAD